MVDRTRRELTDEDIKKIANTYHAWRGEKNAGEYADIPGFCKDELATQCVANLWRTHLRLIMRLLVGRRQSH